MIVKIHNQHGSDPIVYPEAKACFQKVDMFCVYFTNKDGQGETHKYPMQHIFRVENSYPPSDHGEG